MMIFNKTHFTSYSSRVEVYKVLKLVNISYKCNFTRDLHMCPYTLILYTFNIVSGKKGGGGLLWWRFESERERD